MACGNYSMGGLSYAPDALMKLVSLSIPFAVARTSERRMVPLSSSSKRLCVLWYVQLVRMWSRVWKVVPHMQDLGSTISK